MVNFQAFRYVFFWNLICFILHVNGKQIPWIADLLLACFCTVKLIKAPELEASTGTLHAFNVYDIPYLVIGPNTNCSNLRCCCHELFDLFFFRGFLMEFHLLFVDLNECHVTSVTNAQLLHSYINLFSILGSSQ